MMKTLFCCVSILLFAVSVFAANKVVVVPLSSSSVSKQQTYMYDRDAFTIPGSGGDYIGYTNGCAVRSDGGSGYVPLTLPLGARIVSAYVSIYDSPSTDTYWVGLKKHYISGGSYWGSTIIYTTGGSGTTAGVVKRNLTPKTTEIVEADESFSLEFNGQLSVENGFCMAQITLELP